MLLRRGGLTALIALALGYVISGFYAADIAITRNERIGLAGGMCRLTWRTVPNPDMRMYATGAGIYFNKFANGQWFSSFSYDKRPEYSFVWFPMWVFIAAAAIGTLVGFIWRDREHGLCQKCGYERQGIGLSAACPECGLLPPGATT